MQTTDINKLWKVELEIANLDEYGQMESQWIEYYCDSEEEAVRSAKRDYLDLEENEWVGCIKIYEFDISAVRSLKKYWRGGDMRVVGLKAYRRGGSLCVRKNQKSCGK